MIWSTVLVLSALALWVWFITMASVLTGPIGALIASAGPFVVGTLLYLDFRR